MSFLILCLIAIAVANGLPSNFVCENMSIVKREEWGSTSGPRKHNMPGKPDKIFVHHTATEECATRKACEEAVKQKEKLHTQILDEEDIDVQFLIGGDGLVYEGRGWDAVGPHTSGYPDSFGVAFIGTFEDNLAPDKMMYAFKQLILCGIKYGAIAHSASIYGHSNARCTTHCPGAFLKHQISQLSAYNKVPIKCTIPI